MVPTGVPLWAWVVLGAALFILATRNGWLAPSANRSGPSPAVPLSLDSLQGYKTKLAALVFAVLAANEALHFIPAPYVHAIMQLAAALGLYGLRDAIDRLPKPEGPKPPEVSAGT